VVVPSLTRSPPIPCERVSIIIPALNEERSILSLLRSLQSFRCEGHELILVDGGSRDHTLALARPLVDQVISGPRGRAVQMNTGAQRASGGVLWFLHADSGVSVTAIDALLSSLAEENRCWGRFDVALSGRHRLLRVVEFMMNRRSRLTGIATGDQGIFVRRQTFERIGGFPEIELMEDVAISRRLKALAPPCCLSDRILILGRRGARLARRGNAVIFVIFQVFATPPGGMDRRSKTGSYCFASPYLRARHAGSAPRKKASRRRHINSTVFRTPF